MIEKIDLSSIVRASHTNPQLVTSLLHSVVITKIVLPAAAQSFTKATIFRLIRDDSSDVAIIHHDCNGAVVVSSLRSKKEEEDHSSNKSFLRTSCIEDFSLLETQEGHVYVLLLHSNRVLSIVAVSSGLTISSILCSDQFQALSVLNEAYYNADSTRTGIRHHMIVMLHSKDMNQQHAVQLVSISFLGTSCSILPLGCGPLMPAHLASDLSYRITSSTCQMGLINAEVQQSSYISLVDGQRVTVCHCSQPVSSKLRSLLQGLLMNPDPLRSDSPNSSEHASAMQSLGRIILQLLQPASSTPCSESLFDTLLLSITPQIQCSDVLSLAYALLDIPYPPDGFVSKLLTHAEVPLKMFISALSFIQ